MSSKLDASGSGIADAEVGSAARRLHDQISYVGLNPDLETALAAIGELQGELGKERRRVAELERQVTDLEQRLEPDRFAVNEAQRALLFLTRGECPTAVRQLRNDRFETHAEAGGHHCRQLAHGVASIDLALRVIVELCREIHETQHREGDGVERLEDEIEELEAALQEAQAEGADLRGFRRGVCCVLGLDGHHDDEAALGMLRDRLGGREPDPWEFDEQERDSIEHEPASVWTILHGRRAALAKTVEERSAIFAAGDGKAAPPPGYRPVGRPPWGEP
jgi:hypothetical protein